MSGGLAERRKEFFQGWPPGRVLDEALRSRTNPTPLFYFADSTDPDLNRCTWVLGRLGDQLETQFGISSEVLILFTSYDDLQRRTFNALTERLRDEVSDQQRISQEGQVRFTPDPLLSFLYAPDPRAAEKVESWNLEGASSLVVTVPISPTDPQSLRTQLRRSMFAVLSERDLYQGRHPVTGSDFFGREHTLKTLLTTFRDGHSVGLFGLRRSGKTSVIRELKRRNESKGFSVVISDLEATGSLAELPAQICADMNATLRDLRKHDSTVWLGSQEEQAAETFSQLSTRIQKVAERNSRYRFVFAFDEIESLAPFVQSDPMRVRTFLGAVRRAAQGSRNVCLLMTGVTSRFFRDSMLDPAQGVENPMFGFVDEVFLGPFDEEETADLLRKLGQKMTLIWDGDALRQVNQATGGFPFLVRDLASAARQLALQARPDPRADANTRITAEIVSAAYRNWRDSAAELWAQIVTTLRTHHELMAEMVGCQSEAEVAEWLQLGGDADRAARSLAGLGLLTRAGSAWRRSDPLRSLQGLSRMATSHIENVRASARERSEKEAAIRELARREEGPHLEFKSSATVGAPGGRPGKGLTSDVVKTVAGFLNAEGGVLLIGVADDGTIVGVDREIKATGDSWDKFLLLVNNGLRRALGNTIVKSCVMAELVEADGGTVCKVAVKPRPDGVWCEEDGDDVFYIRNGNQTVKLRNREVPGYLASRT